MKRDEALAYVQSQLDKDRYEHTLRVAEVAVQLAEIHNVSKRKTELAAIFHDYAKNRNTSELKRWIMNSYLPKDLLSYDNELWHAPVGSILVERECGITDRDILNAIHYHTTGHPNMNKIAIITFVADYIEPDRDFPGITEVREMATVDLFQTAKLALRNTIHYLLEKEMRVYPDTFHAYNDLMKEQRK